MGFPLGAIGRLVIFLRAMARAARLALLIFQAVWLNAIVPGHTRGVVQLPVGESSGQSQTSCCAERGRAGPESRSPAPARQTGNCAVCFFAANLSPPPMLDLTPPPL